MIPDSSYKQLAEEVYNVEPSKAERNDANAIVKGRLVKDRVTEKQYQVLLTQDNNAQGSDAPNGMQAMAVAPIVDGKVDTSQVVVVYAGTNSDDVHDVHTDMQMIIGGDIKTLETDVRYTPIPNSNKIMVTNDTVTESQLVSAQKFYDKVRSTYPKAFLTTTGHSLGAYLALTIGAENQIPATAFNGPDPIRAMSKKAVKWVKENPHLYTNYRIKYDAIGNLGAYYSNYVATDDLGISYYIDGKGSLSVGANHSLKTYRFNKEGRVIDSHGNIVNNSFLSSITYNRLLVSISEMKSVRNLQSKWQSTGGGISAEEEIFLDAAQGHVIGESMATAARLGLEELRQVSTKTNQEVEKLWSEIDFNAYSSLTFFEVQEIFAAQGVTYDTIVNDMVTYTSEKVKACQKLSETFDTLKSNIDKVITDKLALDSQLAGEFRIWYQKN